MSNLNYMIHDLIIRYFLNFITARDESIVSQQARLPLEPIFTIQSRTQVYKLPNAKVHASQIIHHTRPNEALSDSVMPCTSKPKYSHTQSSTSILTYPPISPLPPRMHLQIIRIVTLIQQRREIKLSLWHLWHLVSPSRSTPTTTSMLA